MTNKLVSVWHDESSDLGSSLIFLCSYYVWQRYPVSVEELARRANPPESMKVKFNCNQYTKFGYRVVYYMLLVVKKIL